MRDFKLPAIIGCLALLIYSIFGNLMMDITLQYIPYDTDVAFLRIKQDEMALDYYKVAFFIHVYTSMLVLLAAFTQFSDYFLKMFPKIHKTIGWIYVIVVLGFSAPSGLIMGYHANGGWSSQLAFCLLSILWFYFTLRAIIHIKNKKVKLHNQFMLRSFALTMSAITLRAWKYIIVALFEPKPMDVYRLVAWLSWVVNLLIIEIYIYYKYKDNKI